MKTLRRTVIAAALTGAMGLAGSANAVTIDGITFTSGAIFETINLFEGERAGCPAGSPTCNGNGVIDLPGEELVGIGQVTAIRDKDTLELLWAPSAGRELTVYFHSYIAEVFNVGVGVANIGFTGGIVEIYSDSTPNFNPSLPQPGGIATAIDGNLWLSLAGSPLGDNPSGSEVGALSGDPITLESRASSLTGPGTAVLGSGLLDVTGGLAQTYFDTNTFTCAGAAGGPCPNDADKSFTSSGQLAGASSPWGFFGTGEVQDVSIPEPGALALLGLGLAGLGAVARRKVNA